MRRAVKDALTQSSINADIVDTPIFICDINDDIIYKNNAAYLANAPRKNTSILAYIPERDRIKYISVKNGESQCECISVFFGESSVTGYVCQYKSYSLETFFIIPKSVGGFTDSKHALNFRNYISKLAKTIDYGFESCKKQRRVLKGIELLRSSNFLCLMQIMSLSRTMSMHASDAQSVIVRYLSRELLPAGYSINGADINDECNSIYFENSEILISAFMNMLTVFISEEPGNVNISVKNIDKTVCFEALFRSRLEIDKRYDDIITFAENFPEKECEISILQFLCNELGWDIKITPYFSSDSNMILSLTSKAKRSSKVHSACYKGNSDIVAYLRFTDYLNLTVK